MSPSRKAGEAGVAQSTCRGPRHGDDNSPGRHGVDSRAHLSRVSAYLQDLPEHASVVTGGAPAPGPGFFFAPTVVTGVRQGDAIVQDEVFGPVLTVQPLHRRGRRDPTGQRRALRPGGVRVEP
ncbi:aldehyde dehydrogenase family protein [Embleya sp. NPDC050154]|uniref:aldehyde dehydrogenase family protein n=1 Tax=Embleya sp. NPDC050154 TaxID=3363988 RepID=UPI003787FEC8